jgi:AbrB family looped-hinge helix DNA binding protein
MVGIEIYSTIGEKGQVVIPKPIRDQFHLTPKTDVVFTVVNNKLVLRKKKSGLDILDDFVTAGKGKRCLPKKIDWDELYYSQFEK